MPLSSSPPESSTTVLLLHFDEEAFELAGLTLLLLERGPADLLLALLGGLLTYRVISTSIAEVKKARLTSSV